MNLIFIALFTLVLAGATGLLPRFQRALRSPDGDMRRVERRSLALLARVSLVAVSVFALLYDFCRFSRFVP